MMCPEVKLLIGNKDFKNKSKRVTKVAGAGFTSHNICVCLRTCVHESVCGSTR